MERWFSKVNNIQRLGIRAGVILAMVCAIGAGAAQGQYSICIDPGHGGEQSGCVGLWLGLKEKVVNLEVAYALEYLLYWDWNFEVMMTRYTDEETVSPEERVVRASGSDIFVSIHHNYFAPGTENGTETFYCPDNLNGLGYESLELAEYVHPRVWQAFMYRDRGIKDDLESDPENPEHYIVLRTSTMPSILGEASNMCGDQNEEWLMMYDSEHKRAEATGYYQGVCDYYELTGVGIYSFEVVGGDQINTLTWSVGSPYDPAIFRIYRSDSCWGPWDFVMSISSGDTNYTSDNEHYTYVDDTVEYSRAYLYQLREDEDVLEDDGTPQNLPSPTVPGNPSNLVAADSSSGITPRVMLSWSQSADATGYYIYRSTWWPIENCDSPYSYLGSAPGESYEDLDIMAGYEYYYRVRAFNTTTGSDASNQASVTPSPTSVSEGLLPSDGRTEPFARAYPNPFNPVATIAYNVPVGGSCVLVRVFDVDGGLVRTLVDEVEELGTHQVQWDGRDERGVKLPSGVYFYQVKIDGYSDTEKMILLE
jgi:N-acetylmuramoyl-L-alanine amidase